MHTIQIEHRSFEIPSQWSEVTPKHAKDIAVCLLASLSITDFKSSLMLRWLNLHDKLFTFEGRLYIQFESKRKLLLYAPRMQYPYLNPGDWSILCQTIDWLFVDDKDSENPRFRSQLINNPLPQIKSRLSSFIGPDHFLADCSAIEFAKADTRCMNFRSTNDPKYLDEMIAILYRPRKNFIKLKSYFSGELETDDRIPYSDACISNAKHFSKIDFVYKFLILLFFEGCSHVMANKYRNVFSGSSNSESSGWASVFQMIAPDVTKIEKVMHINIHTLLFDFDEKIKQSIQDRKKYKL